MFEDGTRGQILRGTATVIARQGVRACKVQDVLDAGGVSRRTFYKHFDSMEDALDGLFEAATAVLPDTIEVAAASASTPREQLERAVDAFLNLQLQRALHVLLHQPLAKLLADPLILAPPLSIIILHLVLLCTGVLAC